MGLKSQQVSSSKENTTNQKLSRQAYQNTNSISTNLYISWFHCCSIISCFGFVQRNGWNGLAFFFILKFLLGYFLWVGTQKCFKVTTKMK